MTTQKPIIDTARVNFSGMSEEEFEDLGETNVGDIRYFTVRARVRGYSVVDMAESGVRRLANLKILKVVEGVSEKVRDDGDSNQKTLFDPPTDESPSDDADTDADTDEETGSEAAVARPAFGGGPQFSSGDDE